MSIEQIEQAIERLPAAEREALESRLLARRCGLDALNEKEQAELLASLDEAERDIDEGRTLQWRSTSPGRPLMAWEVIRTRLRNSGEFCKSCLIFPVLKLARRPVELAAARAALPSMSLVPLAPFLAS